MRTLKLTIAYDGTRFVGWQRQAEGVSIQGLIEEALARFEGAPVTIHGAGRTDAGVHALGQVASVQLASGHDTATLVRGLNAALPDDVRIVAIDEVGPDFHARFSARRKSYRYQLRSGGIGSPFDRAYVWHVPERLDVEAMQRAAQALVGTHDFAAFQSTGTSVPDSVRTITHSVVAWGEPSQARHADLTRSALPLLVYDVTGTGFLRHMVRAIVGTLVDIGRGWRPADSVPALVAGKTRAAAGPTAPPHGLFLVRVEYD